MPNNMGDLPEPNKSRVESYLGKLCDQPGASMPDHPQSRVEQYLEYLVENGGGGGSGIRVGIVTNGSSFPTSRPDGSSLINGDYVAVSAQSEFPFEIDGVTFNSSRDKGIFQNGNWEVEVGISQDTDETPVSNPSEESISGQASTQNIVNKEFKETINELIEKVPTSVRRLGEYLYEASFDSLVPPNDNDETFAIRAGCSSFVRDGKLYRNFDWNYDNTASFHVICKEFEGMASISGLDDGDLDFNKIEQLPYHVVDGVNKYGIMVSTHVLFNDWGYSGSGNKDSLITRLPYYILTNLKDVTRISIVLSEYLNNIKIPDQLAAMEYLLQFVVTDGTRTYAILPPEDSSGRYMIMEITSNPKLTNFRWVADAIVERANLQTRPNGVERWNQITNTTQLSDLKFTRAYESPDRLSEFIGMHETTKYSTDEELEEIYEEARAEYRNRQRDGKTWQTVHSVIYNQNGLEALNVQENYNKSYANPHINIEDLEEEIAGKVSKSDIVDDLESTDPTKVLSANMGRELAAYVDDSISDTMSYVMQEDAAERAAREAGDNLINAKIDDTASSADKLIPESKIDEKIDESIFKLIELPAIMTEKQNFDISQDIYDDIVADFKKVRIHSKVYNAIDIAFDFSLLSDNMYVFSKVVSESGTQIIFSLQVFPENGQPKGYFSMETISTSVDDDTIIKNSSEKLAVGEIHTENLDSEITELLEGLETQITNVETALSTETTNRVNADNELETNKEDKSNKTSTLNASSTNTQYAGAKAVYDLVKIAGHSLTASIDTTTYIMTLILKDKSGNALSTQTIDLPLESLVLNVEYVDTTEHPKSIKITLQNGTVTYVPIGSITTGLENTSNKIATWGTPTDEQYPGAKLVKDSLDTKQNAETGKGLSTNDYDNTEKAKLAGIEESAKDNIVLVNSDSDIPETLDDQKLYNIKQDINIYTDSITNKRYKLVKYIESHGNEYIDSGVIGSNLHDVELQFQFPTLGSQSARLFGYRGSDNVDQTCLYISGFNGTTNSNCYYGAYSVGYFTNGAPKWTTSIYTIKSEYDTRAIYVNGAKKWTGTTTAYTNTYSMPLFGIRQKTSDAVTKGVGRIYYCIIRESGTEVRHFIAVQDLESGEYGMFDTVANKFYANNGTGAFTGGDDKGFVKGLYKVNNNTLVRLTEINEVYNKSDIDKLLSQKESLETSPALTYTMQSGWTVSASSVKKIGNRTYWVTMTIKHNATTSGQVRFMDNLKINNTYVSEFVPFTVATYNGYIGSCYGNNMARWWIRFTTDLAANEDIYLSGIVGI